MIKKLISKVSNYFNLYSEVKSKTKFIELPAVGCYPDRGKVCYLCGSTNLLKEYDVDENRKMLVCNECWRHIAPNGQGPVENIYKTFSLECAHFIPGHKTCGRVHGHTIKCSVGINGRVNLNTGMVIDFKEVKRILQRIVIDKFDHSYLNDTFSLPTAELIAFYIYRKLQDNGLNVYVVKVHETADNYAEFSPLIGELYPGRQNNES